MNYYSHVMNKKPVAYWRLGEATGTTAIDATGNGNSGALAGGITLAQPGAILGDPNKSMLFNGTTGIITIASTPLGVTSAFTIESWAYNTGAPTGQNGVIGAHNFGTTSITDIQYNNNSIRYEMVNTAGTNQYTINGTYNNVWMYIALSVSGTTLMTALGLPTGISIVTHVIVSAALTIGPNWKLGNWDGFFNGYLDEQAIYGYGLTADQMTDNYHAGIDSQITRNRLRVI